MSDSEVFQYFKNQDKITCGRFHHSQIILSQFEIL